MPLREGQPIFRASFTMTAMFQVMPLREGQQNTGFLNASSRRFQVMPLREGQPCRGGYVLVFHLVSSHAPTRGATLVFSKKHGIKSFQVMPLREGQPKRRQKILYPICFKSCPYARGNEKNKELKLMYYVSSHAPTRGATQAGALE